jgi:hypothetical protein
MSGGGVNLHQNRNFLQLGSRTETTLAHLMVYGVLKGFAVTIHAAMKEYDG